VLHPGAVTSARLVRAVESLGDDALEASLLRRGEHRLRPANEVARHAPGGSLQLELLKQLTPGRIREVEGGAASEVKRVEGQERRRRSGGRQSRRPPVRAKPPAEALEVGLTVGAEADQLAVQDRSPGAERVRHRFQLRELGAAVSTRARADAEDAAVPAELGAHAVELHLERPPVAARDRTRAGKHRLDTPRLSLQDATPSWWPRSG